MIAPTRRNLLAAAGGAALAGTVSAAASHPIRLGGPIFIKSDDPRELAREHRRLGYAAAYCPNVTLNDRARIKAVQDAFQAENVVIAEVGAWKNMLDPDPEERRKNIAYVTERLALAEAVGARCCVDIAGSYNPKVWYGPHKDNFSQRFFDATVENMRKLIDQVKPKRTKMTIEMMGWAIPDGPDSYLRLIKAIDRPAFGVHIDVCNGINSPERFYRSGEFIADCFRKLGQYTVSCHAKDLAWKVEMNVHFVEVVPGRGEVDYRTYLREVARTGACLMLEHLSKAEEYDEGRAYIQKVAREAGVSFV
jgi:sugar phosphate isomerase/epimerase